jgi:hypothetical protein
MALRFPGSLSGSLYGFFNSSHKKKEFVPQNQRPFFSAVVTFLDWGLYYYSSSLLT